MVSYVVIMNCVIDYSRNFYWQFVGGDGITHWSDNHPVERQLEESEYDSTESQLGYESPTELITMLAETVDKPYDWDNKNQSK